MNKQEFYDHAFDFFKGISAVLLVAIGQALIKALFISHPELFLGVSQTAAAVAAIKFTKF